MSAGNLKWEELRGEGLSAEGGDDAGSRPAAGVLKESRPTKWLQPRRAPLVARLREELTTLGWELNAAGRQLDEQALRQAAEAAVQVGLKNFRSSNLIASSDKGALSFDLSELQVRPLTLTGSTHLLSGIICQDALEYDHDERAFIGATAASDAAPPLAGLIARLAAVQACSVARSLLSSKLIWAAGLLHEGFLTALYTAFSRTLAETAIDCDLSEEQETVLFGGVRLQLLIITPAEALVLGTGSGFLKWRGKYRRLEPAAAGSGCTMYIAAHGSASQVIRSGVAIASNGMEHSYEVTDAEARDRTFAVEHQLQIADNRQTETLVTIFNLLASQRGPGEKLPFFEGLLRADGGNCVTTAFAQQWRQLLAAQFCTVFGLEGAHAAYVHQTGLDELLSGTVRSEGGCYRLLNPGLVKEQTAQAAAVEVLAEFGIETAGELLPLSSDLSLILAWHRPAAGKGGRQTANAAGFAAAPQETAGGVRSATAAPAVGGAKFKAYEIGEEISRHHGNWDLWSTPDMVRQARERQSPRSADRGSERRPAPDESPGDASPALPPNGSLMKRLFHRYGKR